MARNRVLLITSAVVLVSGAISVLFTNCAGQGFATLSSSSLSGDPLLGMAWHLNNTGQSVYASKGGTAGVDMNLLSTWQKGILGSGVRVMISDTGFEDTHEDLHGNFSYDGKSKDYTLAYPYLANTAGPKTADDNHGTCVAGLIGAVAGNGVGSSGVAPKATLLSANLISGSVTLDSYAKIIDQLEGDFDISNMSWGSTQNMVDDDADGHNSNYEAQLKNLVTTKRNGKGIVYVKAAGNDFVVGCYGNTSVNCIGNSNFDRDNANPYMMIVAALDANGVSADYSSAGANLWISSFGGMYGTDTPAMVTTDRTGCSLGESQSSLSTTLGFEKGKLENAGCNYTITFNGTSSAAPTLSGAVALLLHANPQLTWRDVKYILAKTARPGTNTSSISHPLGTPMPSGYSWEQGWVTNAAGFKFHNWYGFGVVNVDEAVKLAQNYSSPLGTYHETSWYSSGSVGLAIPDYSATGAVNTISVSDVLKVEAVRIKLNITHSAISQLAVELTSPSGTKSILINAVNSLTNQANFTGREIFLSNAFYGESAAGNWTLRVIDAVSGTTGTLNSWNLELVGGQ